PAKKPLLIIVDDAWPTDAAFLTTKNIVSGVFPELRKANSDLANSYPPTPAPKLSEETKKLSSPGVPNGIECVSLSKCDTHANRIAVSLAPFQAYAEYALGEAPVDTIYVPLTASQQGAKDFLRLLWNLAYAAGTDLAPNSSTFFNEEKTGNRQEREFTDSLEEKLHGGEFISNWAILTSVFYFARRYSELREVPVYISLSWTAEDLAFNPPPLTDWGTLIVAA